MRVYIYLYYNVCKKKCVNYLLFFYMRNLIQKFEIIWVILNVYYILRKDLNNLYLDLLGLKNVIIIYVLLIVKNVIFVLLINFVYFVINKYIKLKYIVLKL